MKKNILFALLLFCGTAFAQHRADKWYFGVLAGLDFTGGGPAAVSTPIFATSGSSSVTDTSGAILFYTDGMSVWDRTNQVMPGGSGLPGGAATQASLVVPQPGSDSLFYLFTVDAAGGPNGFRYSIVDMSLRSDSGDVIASSKNILVRDSVTEKLTAVKNAAGSGYWIAVHVWGSDEFDIYELTSAGLTLTPVISHTGMVHSTGVIQYTYGEMKFSPCGDRIATTGYEDTVQVFDFNSTSGMVSAPITIPLTYESYGLEFSDDSRMLYVSTKNPDSTLVQYDLAAGSIAGIIASAAVISTVPDIYGLQLAPDRKIYASKSFSQYLGVINSPELPGTLSNYTDSALNLDPLMTGSTSGLGLPDFVQSFFTGPNSCLLTQVKEGESESENDFLVYPNPFSSPVTIQYPEGNSVCEIRVLDISGKTLLDHVSSSNENKFSFGGEWVPGIYFVRIISPDGMHVQKLIRLQ